MSIRFPILCCLLLLPCYLSQSVTISISPETIYVESAVNITCVASADSDTLLSLIPLYLINDVYIQYSCIGNSEFQPLSQNFSTLPFAQASDSTLASSISLNPVSLSDNGLSIGCVFYNLQAENYVSSNVITLSVHDPTTATSTSEVNTTTAITITEASFLNSQEFYITVGSVGGVVAVLLVIVILLILIIPVVVFAVKKSKRREPSTQEQGGTVTLNAASPINEYLTEPVQAATKEDPDQLVKSRTSSIKAQNEKEFASRYTALPSYSVAVNIGREELSESTNPDGPPRFSSIDIDKEKQETDS